MRCMRERSMHSNCDDRGHHGWKLGISAILKSHTSTSSLTPAILSKLAAARTSPAPFWKQLPIWPDNAFSRPHKSRAPSIEGIRRRKRVLHRLQHPGMFQGASTTLRVAQRSRLIPDWIVR